MANRVDHTRGTPSVAGHPLTLCELRGLSGYEGATCGLWDPSQIAEQVFGAAPTGPDVFSYCYRRFGLPNTPGDADREVASYLLQTPMQGVLLSIIIRPPGLDVGCFGYLVRESIHWAAISEIQSHNARRAKAFEAWKQARRSTEPEAAAGGFEAVLAFNEQNPPRDYARDRGLLGRVHRALRATLKELCRPVAVRDSYFNALGKVEEAEVRRPAPSCSGNTIHLLSELARSEESLSRLSAQSYEASRSMGDELERLLDLDDRAPGASRRGRRAETR